MTNNPESTGRQWDLTYDVVVAGFGYSGGMASVAAVDAGSTVGLFEKATRPGGNSVLSGGSCVYGEDYELTLAYLRETCDGNTDDDVLKAFASGMIQLPELLSSLADAADMKVYHEPRGEAAYPFTGRSNLRMMRVTRNPKEVTLDEESAFASTSPYPGLDWVTGPKAGATLFWVLMENVRMRPRISVHLDSPVQRLITEGRQVVGCVVNRSGKLLNVKARQGVVLCTGGFEHNRTMIRHFVGSAPTIAVSPLGNTGDGISMAQALGAGIWHMWHLHGGYGFHIPETPVAIRHSYTGPRRRERPMPWILVNRTGRRFMNELPPAPNDTPIREMIRFDADSQSYLNIPSYMILDERGLRSRPLGSPVMTDPAISYVWSSDNQKELAAGYVRRANSSRELAGQLNIEEQVLAATIENWNEMCTNGEDCKYGRPNWSMMPLHPPYYHIETHPIITNTQGGLIHDSQQRVLDTFGNPIPRLYKAGENGSIFGHLYLLGGNNTECFVGGLVAGQNAASEKPVVG